MAQSKYKIHWIDQNSIERKCPLFDSKADFSYIYRGKCLHAICPDGVERVAPLSQGKSKNGVKIKTSDAVGVYSLNEIDSSSIHIMSGLSVNAFKPDEYSDVIVTYERTITAIVKTVVIDYDIDIIIYDDQGHSTTVRMNTDDYSLSFDGLKISNTSGNFYVKVKTPIVYRDVKWDFNGGSSMACALNAFSVGVTGISDLRVFEKNFAGKIRYQFMYNESSFYNRTVSGSASGNNTIYDFDSSVSSAKIDIPFVFNYLNFRVYCDIDGRTVKMYSHDYSIVSGYIGGLFLPIADSTQTVKIPISGDTEIASQTRFEGGVGVLATTIVVLPLTLE